MADEAPDWLKESETMAGASSSSPSWANANTNTDVEHQPVTLPSTTINGGVLTATDIETSVGTTVDDTNNTPDAVEPKTWGRYFGDTFRRDGRLLLITLAILIVMNVPFLRWILYPFILFSTWIHEICHGMAAIFVGGRIAKLEIFRDGSGLAYTSLPSSSGRGFIISAGYQGTAVVGCLLLMLRRTKRGPRTCLMAIAVFMILSVMLWIRNAFGILFLLLLGVVLAVSAWKLPSLWLRNLYVCIAAMTSLDAIASVKHLFGNEFTVNGQTSSTDAHSMAELKGGSHTMWAFIWLLLSLSLTAAGFLFAIPGPDEVADFTLCGVCQDMGCFRICNLPGQRWMERIFSPNTSASDDNDAGVSTNANTTTESRL